MQSNELQKLGNHIKKLRKERKLTISTLCYKNALEHQQAVYVLTDTNTGKLYVGSATSKGEQLLARWKGYILTFHNGNVDLKNLFEKEGAMYFKKYFKYSIIENFNANTNPDYILERESYWKNVLDTRNHGYNKN